MQALMTALVQFFSKNRLKIRCPQEIAAVLIYGVLNNMRKYKEITVAVKEQMKYRGFYCLDAF